MGGMGDVKKVGKIEIEDNGEKKQINNDRTPRGTKGRPQASRIGLKHPLRQVRRNLTK